jgi:hypothetical protein
LPLSRHDFNALKITCWKDAQRFYQVVANPEQIEDDALKKVIGEIRIIAIDSLSELADMGMRHILEVDRKQLVQERTGGKANRPEKVYEDLMTMEDWNLLNSRIRGLLAAFCQLPYHVIFTCLSTWSKDREGGATFRTPALSGQLATKCPAYFDLVLYMESQAAGGGGQGTRLWRTFNDGRIIAKDASGVLAPHEPPDWTAVFTKILGNGKNGDK